MESQVPAFTELAFQWQRDTNDKQINLDMHIDNYG